jgi:penicillin amidase
MGQVRPLGRLFNRGPIPVDGDMNTVKHASYAPASPYHAGLAVVSYRQIIDLSDFRNSLSMGTTGQSGQPGSRHYDDMVGPWLSVEYHPMLFERPDVLEAAESTLMLRPEGQE